MLILDSLELMMCLAIPDDTFKQTEVQRKKRLDCEHLFKEQVSIPQNPLVDLPSHLLGQD